MKMTSCKSLTKSGLALAVAALCAAPAQADWKDTAKAAWNDLTQGRVPKQVPPTQTAANRPDSWGDGPTVQRRETRDPTPMTTPSAAGAVVEERGPDGRPILRETLPAQTPTRRATGAAAAAGAGAGAATAAVLTTPQPLGDGWSQAGSVTTVRRTATSGDAFPPPADLPFQYVAPEPTNGGGNVQRQRISQARNTGTERTVERVVERSGDRPVARAADRGMERGGERSSRFVDRDSDRGEFGLERSGTRGASMSERSTRQGGTEAFLGSVSCTNVARAWEGAANAADAGRTDRAYAAYVKLLSACKSERELLGTVYQAIRYLPTDALMSLSDEPVMSSVALQDMAYELRSNLLFRFNREKKVSDALKMADELREPAILRKDANVLTVAGYLELQAKRTDKAQNTFRAALKADRDHDKAREGLALVLLAAGKADAAWREADRLTGPGADSIKATVRLAQARQAFENNEPRESLKLLGEAEKLGAEFGEPELALRAWSLKQSGQADKSSKIFAQLNRTAPENKEYATGLVEAYRTAGDFQKIEKLTESVSVVGPIAQAAIADQYTAQGRYEEASALRGEPVEGTGTPTASVTIAARSKSGDAGAGRLTVTGAPEVAVSAPIGSLGRLVANIGSLRMTDGLNDVTAREGRIGFITKGQTTVSGGMLMTTALGNTRVGGDLTARRFNAGGYNQVMVGVGPIYDSVRSFAGVMGADGFFVGRANQTVFGFSGNQTVNADWKVDYNLQMGSITGRNINSNGFYRAVLGGTHNLAEYGMPWLTAGPQVHVGGYREDQNVFDRAAGGYFSPKSDTGFGVKAYLAYEHGNRMIVRGSAYAGYVNRAFNEFTDSGVQLEGDVAASYLFTDSLIGSVGTTLRSSPGYSDAAFWLSVTVPFEKRSTLNSRDVVRPTLGIR